MKVILNNIIFEIIINKIVLNIYRIFIGIEVIFSIISVFLNTLITTKGTENTYFIKNKIIIFLFIFIVNKYNYKTEIIGS
jgi:hypothetical protein